MSTVIAILTRSPADPRLKTRLSSALPDSNARRELALAFLDDELAHVRTIGGVTVRVAVTQPFEGMRMSRPELRSDVILAQRGQTSAERQMHVLEDLAKAGFSSVVMMGGDVPDLPARMLQDAVMALEKDPSAVVLGPSHDGGYYLLGLTVKPGPIPDLFAKLRWSTEDESADLGRAVAEAGRTLVRLEPWRDVDTPDDLTALVARLNATPEAAPVTAEQIRKLRIGESKATGT